MITKKGKTDCTVVLLLPTNFVYFKEIDAVYCVYICVCVCVCVCVSERERKRGEGVSNEEQSLIFTTRVVNCA